MSTYTPTSQLIQQLPPADKAAEAALIGSIISDATVLADVTQILSGPDDFADIRHSTIYRFLVDLAASRSMNVHLDSVMLLSELKTRGLLEAVGGPDYLLELVESVPIASNAPHYANLVAASSKRRRMIYTGHGLIQLGYEGVGTIDELFDQAQSQMVGMLGQRDRASVRSASDAVADMIAEIGEHDEHKPVATPTGFWRLDEMILGLEHGLTYVIGARPSVGKTTLAIQLMLEVALRGGWRCLFFSLETDTIHVARRVASQLAGIPMWVLRRRKLSVDDWTALADAHQTISNAKIDIIDCPSASSFDIRAMTCREHARERVDMVVIDYLQLVTHPNAKSRENEVSSVSRAMKGLGRELNIAVVELAQLNRNSGERPRVLDLRDSGQIEQDADNIWLLHREDHKLAGEKGARLTNEAELIVAKQKDGETGSVDMRFLPGSMKFECPRVEEEVPAALYEPPLEIPV